MSALIAVVITSLTMSLLGDDDTPAPKKPPTVAKTEKKIVPHTGKETPAVLTNKKTTPKDWSKNINGVPQPPNDWFRIERFEGDKRPFKAVVTFLGEKKTRTIQIGNRLERGVEVFSVEPRLGQVLIRISDGNLRAYWAPGREPVDTPPPAPPSKKIVVEIDDGVDADGKPKKKKVTISVKPTAPRSTWNPAAEKGSPEAARIIGNSGGR
jgi:hypothetical protein